MTAPSPSRPPGPDGSGGHRGGRVTNGSGGGRRGRALPVDPCAAVGFLVATGPDAQGAAGQDRQHDGQRRRQGGTGAGAAAHSPPAMFSPRPRQPRGPARGCSARPWPGPPSSRSRPRRICRPGGFFGKPVSARMAGLLRQRPAVLPLRSDQAPRVSRRRLPRLRPAETVHEPQMHRFQCTRPRPDISKAPTHNHTNDRPGRQPWQAPWQYQRDDRVLTHPCLARRGAASGRRRRPAPARRCSRGPCRA